ncbi:methyltransferase [Streptomyces filipinensis]|uniref:Methyltransferase n=1 Tax=Streptomyces filipinensis TaxID=66887 RepID=A0A918I709_9ACTN|nr:class I SAM-dependent methyltransferase [Streptomyces filipinensis]GGU80421.1 methyltransferase [Streptomyces filipinensis]
MTTSTGTDWAAWQESWDRQQESYMPDREDRFRIMLDMVEALVGTAPRVLDLACGTGSITGRLLTRFPAATSTGVDLDPALLTIARGTFGGDERVHLVEADLKDPDWRAKLPYDSYDAVLTATALHWLHSEPLAALYGQVAELVRDGGVFMNADHMIDDSTPRINAAERAQRHARMDQARRAGALDWAEWWQVAAEDPVLAEPTARRFEIYGEHADGDMPAPVWHADVLREKGFGEARPVWCSPSDTLLLAVK